MEGRSFPRSEGRGHPGASYWAKVGCECEASVQLCGIGKMAPLVTERGLKSVVWQSEWDRVGAERKGRPGRRRAGPFFPASAQQPSLEPPRALVASDLRPASDFFLLSCPAGFLVCTRNGQGEILRGLRAGLRHPLTLAGSCPQAPPCLSSPGPLHSSGCRRTRPRSPLLRLRRGPTSRGCLSTGDNLGSVFLSRPLLPPLEFPENAYSPYLC